MKVILMLWLSFPALVRVKWIDIFITFLILLRISRNQPLDLNLMRERKSEELLSKNLYNIWKGQM